MTLTEFLKLLEQTPRDWYITDKGAIRRKDRKWNITCCPLTACLPIRPIDTPRYLQAAYRLGILAETAVHIALSADRPTNSATRQSLLKACGLEEKS